MLPMDQATIDLLESGEAEFRFAFAFYRKSATDRFWTGYGNRTFLGQTWAGLGDAQSRNVSVVGDWEQDWNGSFPPHSITLTTNDPAVLFQIFSADEFSQRFADFYVVIIDPATNSIMPTPLHIHKRTMRRGPYNRENSQFVIEFDSPMATLLRRWRRVRAHTDQLEWAAALGEPNDECFADVTSFPRGRVTWPADNWKPTRGT